MADKIPLTALGTEIERRVRARLNRYAPDSPQIREALLRIGLLVEAEAKLTARRKGIIDTGRLINSIRHEIYQRGTKSGVTIGSFGVPYAAMHEFGGPFTDQQRKAMFASLRDRGKLGPTRKAGKGIIQGSHFMARPYLAPSVEKHKDRIINILRNIFRAGN